MTRLTVSVANPIEQNYTSEYESLSSAEEIPRVLWKINVYYDIRKSPPLVAVLINMSLVNAIPS
jgi:hypothetical protein